MSLLLWSSPQMNATGRYVGNLTLIKVMAWCRQSASHYMSQYWPRFMPPRDVTKQQWHNQSFFVFVHGFCFSNNGLNKLSWTSYIHAILRIISRGVSGLATDSPCGVWERGWTTYLLHGSPLFGSHFKLVCKFGVIFHIFIIVSCPGLRFHAWN